MRYEHQGMKLWIEPDKLLASGEIKQGSDVQLTVGVEPADASNRVQVKYRKNGGPSTLIHAHPLRHVGNTQFFTAMLPCATLHDGDTLEYSAVCQCAGREVSSTGEGEKFLSSLQVVNGRVVKGQEVISNMSGMQSAPIKTFSVSVGTPATQGKYGGIRQAPLAITTPIGMGSPAKTLSVSMGKSPKTFSGNADQLKVKQFSLFAIERTTGHPIARMPFYAEVGIVSFSPLPKPECKLTEIIRAVLSNMPSNMPSKMLYSMPYSMPSTLLMDPLCDALSRLLTPETIDRLAGDPTYAAPIISAILQKATDLATQKKLDLNDPEVLHKFLEEAIRAITKEYGLPLAEIHDQEQQRIVWAHPLGVLATDHVGYLSFDLTRLPSDVAGAVASALESRRRNPSVPTDTTIWVYPMAREEARIDGLAQMRVAHDAIVVKIELDMELESDLCQPKLCDSIKNLGIMAMQNPNLTDWRLSPGSFATNPGALVGADGCETILPANVALQEFYFYQVIRLTDKVINDNVMLGVVHEYRLAWHHLGHSLGQILYSLPLAPGETVNLAVIDWTRRDEAQRKERTTMDEQLVHNEHRDRTISETVTASVKEYQHGSSSMSGIAASLGGAIGGGGYGAALGIAGSIGGSTSSSEGSRDIAGSTVQKLSDNITQASSSMRELQSTIVVQSMQSEKEAIETRTVVNYNHSHALTILYYEVLRHYRVVTEVVRRRPAVLVKLKTDWFDGTDAAQNILEHRAGIEAALLNAKYAEGFNALERLKYIDFTKPLPAPPIVKEWELATAGPALRFFEFNMKTGGWFAKDNAEDITVDATLYPAGIQLLNGAARISPTGAFTLAYQNNSFVAALPPHIPSVPWGSIDLIRLHIHQDVADVSFQHIKITGIDIFGNPLDLVDKLYSDGDLTLTNDWDLLLPTRRPQPAPPPPPFYDAATLSDYAKGVELIAHLKKHKRYYSRAIILNQNTVERAGDLEDLNVLGHLENRPLEIVGDYMAYPSTDLEWNKRIKPSLELSHDTEVNFDERLVTLPTRGVFAEAKLGHCNASEKIDPLRFWDWQKSPIPHSAPEIAAIEAGKHIVKDPNLQSTPFPQPIVNIVNPPNAPDPTGLASAMNVLATSNIFRDMSGRAEVADLLKKLSDNSVAIAGVAQNAATGGIGKGSGGTGSSTGSANVGSGSGSSSTSSGNSGAAGSGSQRSTQPRTPQTVAEVNELASGIRNNLSPDQANPLVDQLYQNAVDNASGLDLQQVGDHYVPPAVNPLHPASNELVAMVGEAQLANALEKAGLIVFRDWTKNVSATGIDLIAFDPKTLMVWLVDNKAQFKGIGGANALTGEAFEGYKADVIKFLKEVHPHPRAVEAAKLLQEGKCLKVVGNGWAGTDTRFTKGLFAKGLHVFDIRMGMLFSEQKLWQSAFDDVVKRRVVQRLAGTRGSATVGGMLLTLGLAAGVVFALRAGESAEKVIGQFAAETALGTILSFLPSGFIASLSLGLKNDNQYQIEMSEKIDLIASTIPDFDKLPPAEMQISRAVIREMIENPLEIESAKPPAEPLPAWPPSPSREGSAGGV